MYGWFFFFQPALVEEGKESNWKFEKFHLSPSAFFYWLSERKFGQQRNSCNLMPISSRIPSCSCSVSHLFASPKTIFYVVENRIFVRLRLKGWDLKINATIQRSFFQYRASEILESNHQLRSVTEKQYENQSNKNSSRSSCIQSTDMGCIYRHTMLSFLLMKRTFRNFIR